ncbi:helix-turn-helix transcriptional regulator [Gracilibacillus sp. YIM 98692]|uniref:helix-turn-helix domain-containing protein n=1 Tax=Gracilibacillus sp. YIM 98692 TaxID=2663532 RepID=UPI0013D3F3D7|nr:helix-turn-helix transcriptional regulator [Gracilibacillus sp. YIM 98692]
MPSIKQIFGNNMRKNRLERNLSQEQLAFETNLHRTYISEVERGKRNISIENIELIAKALDIPIAELFKSQ